MKWIEVKNYDAMSVDGCRRIYDAVAPELLAGKRVNLGLATGNTMIQLYELLANEFNTKRIPLKNLHTYNLDEYVGPDRKAVPYSHPLSYRRYMDENLFNRFDPALGFGAENRHFPDPDNGDAYDAEIAANGGLLLQLLGIGFNGHIAFNEPEPECPVDEFARRSTRVISLTALTIATNQRLTAGGNDIVPRLAVTMGMKPIIDAKKHLLLACFPEQEKPLAAMKRNPVPDPKYPASYLFLDPESVIVYCGDVIRL